MAFRPPNFNLSVSIWRQLGTGGTYATPDVSTVGALTLGRRVSMFAAPTGVTFTVVELVDILLPKLTDVRAKWNGVTQDLLEIPAGSKRFYNVVIVDDVGKGWPNEYRLALCDYLPNGAANFTPAVPAPVPLP